MPIYLLIISPEKKAVNMGEASGAVGHHQKSYVQRNSQEANFLRKQEKNEGFLPTARPLCNRWQGEGQRTGKIGEDMR